MAYKLTKKDKSVLVAFYDKESASSKKLSTDGKVLEKIGMGGDVIAQWKGGKIVVASDMPQVKSDEVIIKALKKAVPKNQFKNESKNYGDILSDDMKSILEDIDRLSGLIEINGSTLEEDRRSLGVDLSHIPQQFTEIRNMVTRKTLEKIEDEIKSLDQDHPHTKRIEKNFEILAAKARENGNEYGKSLKNIIDYWRDIKSGKY